MDISARELLLESKKERKSKKKSKWLSIIIFIICFGSGAGLITVGALDLAGSEEGGDTPTINEPQIISGPNVQGTSDCQLFNDSVNDLFSSNSTDRDWYLIGHEFNKEQLSMQYTTSFSINPAELAGFDTEIVYRIVGTGISGTMSTVGQSPKEYTSTIDLSDLDPGSYRVETVIDTPCGTLSSENRSFNISYPIYVVWTMDWEGYEVSDEKLRAMDRVSERHHDIPMTHFFNPRYFLTGTTAAEDRDRYINYILDSRDLNGHTIGLHLHAFPEVMRAAGVTPRSEPAWGWDTNDGYDVLVSGYSTDEMKKVLAWSDTQFRSYGLGSPNMFRAGGWWIEEPGLKALEESNYLLDSSGRESYSLGTKGLYGPWDLSSTTQPYRPNYSNQNSSFGSSSEIMNLWEFPNNGADSTAHTAEQMYSKFRDNFSGVPLDQHKVVTYLSHPDYFDIDQPRMDELLSYIDRDLYLTDDGPVVYATLEEVFNIYIEL